MKATVDLDLLNAFGKGFGITIALDTKVVVSLSVHGVPTKVYLSAQTLAGAVCISVDQVKALGIALGAFGRNQAKTQILNKLLAFPILKSRLLPGGLLEVRYPLFNVVGILISGDTVELDALPI